ncbi:putative symporter YhjB [Brevibacillus reuszeri]|uniref:Sodium:solute symporter n=1 Tax=Brevibacillus reuszeri TaxID=54915 RepID=A0A0K9YP03_9BACL|nr:sodium:solute symporter family protein [Brevibacillus reuszeri]KNB70401.1 sodium:solute symporter [Brevibacillus reuszeri]MED1857933.1 sodium:solute symporter family protein [Brevibacillus reuszeri]GED71804.1 putative symporter YhjB [Brevibacillus reuszeri]
MNSALIIITLFLLFALFVGIRASKGKNMSLEQWTVGGRGFSTLFVFLLMAGENYTTFTFLGASGYTYGKGAPAFYILGYGCLAFVMSYWMLPAVWKYAKKHNLLSFSDFFASKYNSRAMGIVVSIVAVLGLNSLLMVQLKGLGIIVSETSYGLISPTLAIWIGVISMIIYVTVSGIRGSASIAAFKDIIILAIALFLGNYLPIHFYGGFDSMFQAIEAAHPDKLMLPEKGQSISWYVSTILLVGLGYWMYPHSFQATYSAKSAKSLRKNAIIMPLYQILIVLIFFVGFAAILQVPDLKGTDADLALLRLVKETFNPWFVGIVGGTGLLTALVPGSMILLNASTLLAKNVYQAIVPDAPEERITRIAKMIVPLFALMSLYFVFQGGNFLVDLSIFASSILTQLFPAFIFCLPANPFATKQGAFSGIIAGAIFLSYFTITGAKLADMFPQWPSLLTDINPGFFALVINTLVLLVVSVLTRREATGVDEKEQVA